MNDWNESDWFRMWLDMARTTMQASDHPRNEIGNLSLLAGKVVDDSGTSHPPQWEMAE
jgi:hypothetical protein